jgi:hypothetical protein
MSRDSSLFGVGYKEINFLGTSNLKSDNFIGCEYDILDLNLRFKNRKVKNKNPEFYLYCQLLLKQLLRRDISKTNLGKCAVCHASPKIKPD